MPVPVDEQLRPISRKPVGEKAYRLFPPIPLPLESGPYLSLLNRRSSTPARAETSALSLSDLAYLLKCGGGIRDGSSEGRTAPSGGGRYPLEYYALVLRPGEGLASGIYHYGIRAHALEIVEQRSWSSDEMANIASYPWLWQKSVLIVVTGVFARMVDEYGSRGYRYMLLEAGHVGQNMLLAGVERGTPGIPVGAINESVIERFIGLISPEERVLYGLFF